MASPREYLTIDFKLEPYDRRWSGGGGYHPLGNRLGGAFGKSKREYQLEIEARNRKNKAERLARQNRSTSK